MGKDQRGGGDEGRDCSVKSRDDTVKGGMEQCHLGCWGGGGGPEPHETDMKGVATHSPESEKKSHERTQLVPDWLRTGDS